MVPSLSVSTLGVPETAPSEAERGLHRAACNGDRPGVRAALEAGVPVDAPDQGGRSALMIAAEHGHIAVMRELVQAGAQIDRPDRGRLRWPALMHALYADRFAAAAALLEWGAHPGASDDSGYTALMMAAGRGHAGVVRELLRRGADPDEELFLGLTALDYAIGYGHADVVRLLLDAAPQLRQRHNPARRAMLVLADNAGDEEILALLA
ncbi:MAG: ankyrin repeat domain-containing protein [Acidobacteriota bacterium]|jgi:ankyrin repeat protein